MIDRDRTLHRLMAATRKRKAEDRHAREALPRTISIPALPLSVAAFCGAKKCNPCLRKVLLGQGEWPVALQDTQIVTGRNKHPARWMLWRPNRRAQIPSALRSAKPIRWRIR